nr:MAG TPA: hypothetical protein [Caudoviricetes sp.]
MWLESLHTTMGAIQYQGLWLYEQALAEAIELLQSDRLVELPCEIGTELFLIDYPMVHHRLKEYKFIGSRVVMVIECFEFQRTCKRFLDEHFGKTVFLTKEEAEAKLKELEK